MKENVIDGQEAFDTTLDYAVEASGDGKEKKRKKPGELSEKQQIALLNRARVISVKSK